MAKESKIERIARAKAIRGTSQRFLTTDEVLAITTVSYPSLWAWMQQGKFPVSREIAPNRVGWLASEVEAWMEARPPRKLGKKEKAA